jgi:nucleotide-binding universal stress UspA family protein
MTRTVIVPLDGSPVAESALPLARALVRQGAAERVRLVSVVELPHSLKGWITGDQSEQRFQAAEETARQEQYLAGIGSSFAGAPVDTTVRQGKPVDEVLNVAAEQPNPLVVLASSGRSGPQLMVIGSVASRLAEQARCPVLVTRGSTDPDAGQGTASLSRVAVGIDGSPIAANALELVMDLFEADQATRPALHLVHVVEKAAFYAGDASGDLEYGLYQDYLKAGRDKGAGHLNDLAAHCASRGYQATSEVREGHVVEELLAAASDAAADLLVVGAHGHGGVREFFVGSTTAKTLREALLPVLVAR